LTLPMKGVCIVCRRWFVRGQKPERVVLKSTRTCILCVDCAPDMFANQAAEKILDVAEAVQ